MGKEIRNTLENILIDTKFKNFDIKLDFLPKRIGLGYKVENKISLCLVVKKKLKLNQKLLKKRIFKKNKEIIEKEEIVTKGREKTKH